MYAKCMVFPKKMNYKYPYKYKNILSVYCGVRNMGDYLVTQKLPQIYVYCRNLPNTDTQNYSKDLQ